LNCEKVKSNCEKERMDNEVSSANLDVFALMRDAQSGCASLNEVRCSTTNEISQLHERTARTQPCVGGALSNDIFSPRGSRYHQVGYYSSLQPVSAPLSPLRTSSRFRQLGSAIQVWSPWTPMPRYVPPH